MKWIRFKAKGKYYKLFYETTENAISNVIAEVFFENCYQKGLDWIKKAKNPVVIDIGAYVGDSILYLNKCKNTTFYGLEPCRSNFQCLAQTTEGMKNVNIFNNGIMNENKLIDLDFGKTAGSGGESVYETENGSEKVSMIDIETFMETMKIEHVDLLKIDVEGAEYEIFGGPFFEKMAPRIDAIIGETHLKPALPIIAQKQLEGLGYKFEWLPYENYHYSWRGKFGDYEKIIEVGMPTLFFAHR